MKIQKRHWLIISLVLMFIIGAEVFQYEKILKEEIVAAVQTIPNNGHSWSQMESGPDSIQISGRTITNLAAPVNSTDATNKAYVDAASATPLYNSCYVIVSPTAGLNCDVAYTTLLSNPGSSSWTGYGPFAFSGVSSVTFGLAAGNVTYNVGYWDQCNESTYPSHNNFGKSPNSYCVANSGYCSPRISVNGQSISNCVGYTSTQTLKLCCK
ncbi:MAG: hypothetical protein WC420_01215 [Candidatus Paceibacterota bacterium]|jgi:hypothetical protein